MYIIFFYTNQFLREIIEIENIHHLYYIHGNNSWEKRNQLNKLYRKIQQTYFDRLETIYFDGQTINIYDLFNVCEMIPFTYECKCIIVKEWKLDKLSNNEMEILTEILLSIPNYCILIIVNIYTNIPDSKIKNIMKLIKEHGVVIHVSAPSVKQTRDFIIGQIIEYKSQISEKAIQKLINLYNNDWDTISMELSKLQAFCENRQITEEDIDLLTFKPLTDDKIFDIVKSLNNKKYADTLNILGSLLNNQEEPIAIIAALATNFIDLYRAKVAQQFGKTTENVLTSFDYKGKHFRVTNAFHNSGKYSIDQIRSILEILWDGDYQLKSSKIDKKIILETVMAKIIKNVSS